MNGNQPVILGELPSLSRLYINAAAAAARRRVLGSHTGNTLPSLSHEVRGVLPDVGNLTAYQHLVGEPASDILPAGFIHALAFPVALSVMNREDFPLPLLGMVHLKNSVKQRVAVEFNQALDIRSWTENLRGHRSGTQVDVLAEARLSGSTEPAWTGVSTYLAKGVFLPGVDKPLPPSETTAEFLAPNPTAVWQLGVDTGRMYAAVSGDFNPIHLSTISAKALGMRRSIAHGMYLASRALAEVGVPRLDPFTWDVSFEAPVYLPAKVALNIEAVKSNSGAYSGPGSDSGIWERAEYVAWNPRSGRRHFSGSVTSA